MTMSLNLMPPATSSTGLSSTTAATLAYGGWWVTGAIFLFVERRDRFVRFHAAQAVIAFGALALFIVVCAVLALVSLSFLPWMFTPLVSAVGLAWVVGVLVWIVAMWKAVSGDAWRMPLVADFADSLVRGSAEQAL
jgi:uncharacterized membrane protein